ncbi:ABC-2 family transporter [Pseudonocardia hierapolitana]|uniref:Transport permease protein n=1 Tax=Pseudonocardia hierapolitana TaxID=1128676 RepID=A0A561T2Z1_9PSEU|nr:ABC transporter permease [Pseudonocardia hierapolitana]TWF81474.1 ABC-2 family transporter [Pseudonocardia hierapolitana]
MTVLPAPGSQLRWAIADAATLTRRYLAHLRRQPAQLVLTVGFPILIVLIFAYLMGGMMVVPGGDYKQLLLPGMLTMTMLSGIGTTMVAVVTDAQRGITDRFRSMPMAPSAVLVGRAVADLTISAIGLVVLMLAGLAIGWRISGGPLAVAAAVGLLLLLRFAMLWVGIYLGMLSRGTGAVTAAQALEFPVAFLSGVFLAPAAMPAVVSTLAEWNPLSSTAAATRALFGNPGWGGESWVVQHPVLMAVVWPLVIIAVFGPLSVHRYREMSR